MDLFKYTSTKSSWNNELEMVMSGLWILVIVIEHTFFGQQLVPYLNSTLSFLIFQRLWMYTFCNFALRTGPRISSLSCFWPIFVGSSVQFTKYIDTGGTWVGLTKAGDSWRLHWLHGRLESPSAFEWSSPHEPLWSQIPGSFPPSNIHYYDSFEVFPRFASLLSFCQCAVPIWFLEC